MRSDLESTVSSDGVQTNCGPDHVALRLASCLGRAANWLEAHVSHRLKGSLPEGAGDPPPGAGRRSPDMAISYKNLSERRLKRPGGPGCFSAAAVNFPTSPK